MRTHRPLVGAEILAVLGIGTAVIFGVVGSDGGTTELTDLEAGIERWGKRVDKRFAEM